MSQQNDLLRICSQCQKPPTGSNQLQVCSGCRQYYYCGVECQKLHWPRHKPLCKELRSNPKQALLAKKAISIFNNNKDLLDLISLIAYHNMSQYLYPISQQVKPCIIHVLMTSFNCPDSVARSQSNPPDLLTTAANSTYTLRVCYEFPNPGDIVNYQPDRLNIMLSTMIDPEQKVSLNLLVFMDLDTVKQNYLCTDVYINYSKYVWPARILVRGGEITAMSVY